MCVCVTTTQTRIHIHNKRIHIQVTAAWQEGDARHFHTHRHTTHRHTLSHAHTSKHNTHRRAAICPWKLHLFEPHIVFEWQEHHEHRVCSLQEYAVNTAAHTQEQVCLFARVCVCVYIYYICVCSARKTFRGRGKGRLFSRDVRSAPDTSRRNVLCHAFNRISC